MDGEKEEGGELAELPVPLLLQRMRNHGSVQTLCNNTGFLALKMVESQN